MGFDGDTHGRVVMELASGLDNVVLRTGTPSASLSSSTTPSSVDDASTRCNTDKKVEGDRENKQWSEV